MGVWLKKLAIKYLCFSTITILILLSFVIIFNVKAQEENKWTSLAPSQEQRTGLGVVELNGKIYAMGGQQNGPYLDINEEYDPQTNKWTTKTPIPEPMAYFGITVHQNQIYCINGETGSTYAYTPQNDSWETKSPLPHTRKFIRANTLNDKIYVIGGNKKIMNVYDPSDDSWTTKASILFDFRSYSTVCSSVVFNNKIHAFGALPFANSHQIYDPVTDSWSLGEPLIAGYYFAAAGATTGEFAPKQIYVFGASNYIWNGGPDLTGQSYDPIHGNWSIVSSVPYGHLNGGAVVIDDRIYLIGGGIPALAGGLDVPENLSNNVYTPFLYGSIPQISITSPENLIYTQTTISLEFSVNETTSWSGYSLDDQANITVIENTNLTKLSEGTHNLELFVIDIVGDESSSSVTFTIDTLPPNISVLSPENKTYSDSNIRLNVEFEEEISEKKYSLDGYENVTFTEDITLSDLEIGSHNITIYATDLAGHIGVSDIVYFSVEPFPTTLVLASVVIIAVVGVGILVYFKKRKT